MMKRMKKTLAILLTVCMTTMLPTSTFALEAAPLSKNQANVPAVYTGSGASLQLDAGGISGYDSSRGYNYIYYGTWGNEPVRWRVLDDQTNTGGAGLFLLSESLLGHGYDEYHDSGTIFRTDVSFDNVSPFTNTWQENIAQSWCKKFATENLTTQEQAAILPTTKSDQGFTSTKYGYVYPASADILKEDKVFFLSAQEAENTDYGFTDNESRKAYYNDENHSNRNESWWLRSPYQDKNDSTSTDRVGYINWVGDVTQTLAKSEFLARPAFNLDLSAALFKSAAVGGKSSGTVGANALKSVEDNAAVTEWKLTMKDYDDNDQTTLGHDEFNASLNSASNATVAAGGSVSVDYSGAAIGNNEYISAMLVNDSGAVLYYGNIAHNSARGTQEITIPTGLAAGRYTLKIFNEQVNGDYKTDYASEFKDIRLAIPGPDIIPTVEDNKIYANGTALIIEETTGANTTTIYIDANRDGVRQTEEMSLEDARITNAPANGSDLSNYNIYGGSESTEIIGNALITMTGGKVKGIFGGGKETTATVSGKKIVSVSGNPVIGSIATGGIDLSSLTSKAVTISGTLTDGAAIALTNPSALTGHTVVATATNPAYADASKFTLAEKDLVADTEAGTVEIKADLYPVTVNDGTTAQASYEEGTTVTITAKTPESGMQFKGWKVISGGITLSSVSSKTATFEMPANAVEVTAEYEAIPQRAITNITLNKTNLTLFLGQSGTLKATIAPANATKKEVRFNSSNTKVVRVSANGKLTPLKPGKATITCTAGDGSGKKATSKVTVKGTKTEAVEQKVTATKNKATLYWTKVSGASGYEIYKTICGSKKYKKVKTIKNAKTTKCTIKKLKNGEEYKFYIRVYRMVEGKKVYIYKTTVLHVATRGCSLTNAKKVTTNFSKATLSIGKSKKIKAKTVKQQKQKRLLIHEAKFRYMTSNSAVATISKTGKIKAKGKGSCTIYVYANNGVSKKIKVKVQ